MTRLRGSVWSTRVDGHLTRVTADPAYDTLAFYGAAGARGARVVVPPTKTASLSRRGARSGARNRTIRRVNGECQQI